MFTKVTNAVRWVKEGSGNPKKEVPFSESNERPQMNPITSRNGTRGFGSPISPLMSRALPGDDTNSATEEMSTDSDGEVYDSIINRRISDPTQRLRQYHAYSSDVSYSSSEFSTTQVGASIENLPRKAAYTSDGYSSHVSSQKELHARNIPNRRASEEDIPTAPPFSGALGEIKQEKEHSKTNYTPSTVDSSRQDYRVPPIGNRLFYDPMQRHPQYHVYSSDVSSSIETSVGRGRGNVGARIISGVGNNDLASRSEFSTTQVGASIENLPRKAAYTSDGYSSHVSSQKELHARNIPDRRASEEDIPTAPPFSGSLGEIKQEKEHSKTNYTPSTVDSARQDYRVPPIGNHLFYDPMQRHPQYHVYSSDVSSSIETSVGRGRGNVGARFISGVGNNDLASSSEFSTTQVGASIENLPRKAAYTSDGYSSHVSSQKELHARTIPNQRASEEDIPAAPPFSGSMGGIKQEKEHSKTNYTPSTVDSRDFAAVDRNTPALHLNESRKQDTTNLSNRTVGAKTTGSFGSLPVRLPTFHASSSLGPCHSLIVYEACFRLCVHAWAKGCMEALVFLENECALLRTNFGLQQVLLQSVEELLVKRSSEVGSEGAAPKSKKMVGKMKVQVCKVKMTVDRPTCRSFSTIKAPKVKLESFRPQFSSLQSKVSSGWQAVRSTQYINQVSGLVKVGVSTLRCNASSCAVVQETYSCLLRLKSSTEGDTVRMQPGSGKTHIFLPDSLGDDLIVEVQDSKGNNYGRVLARVATISEDSNNKLRWWSIYREPEHELVGKIQLYINYTTSLDENSLMCGSVVETMAYDLVMEVAMKVQNFQQRNLLLHNPWKWLLTEFASYYGVSDAYAKLRYLSYVMDVATPTNDCLSLVYDLLLPVIMKGHGKSTLSHQENRILGEIREQIEQIFALVFENYKSLDESSPSGIMDIFKPAMGVAAPALEPAVKLYKLLNDILSPEAQNKLYSYFQAAAKKRSRRHLMDTDEYVSGNIEGNLTDPTTVSAAYQKMKSLCLNIRKEISTDIEIHNGNILPSSIDLPNLSSAIYSADLCDRLRAFLIACPPMGPSLPVTELVIATAAFQMDLSIWNINPVNGGVDAKELFHLYIMVWIQDKRLSLLETCKLNKVKWSGVRTQHLTTPFVDEIYDNLKETLNDYDFIIRRWPEYTFALENAIVDVEKAVVEALDNRYADVLAPLKEMKLKKLCRKYVQKLAKRTTNPYVVPPELGILLNSMQRMLGVLRPKIELQLNSWGSYCVPDGGNTAPGERLSEVTVMLNSKYQNYYQSIVEKLVENTRLQNSTNLKKILQDSKESVSESDIRSRMQPLTEHLTNAMNHLHAIFETDVFIATCREYWEKMGQDVLSFINRKENSPRHKGSRVAVSILGDTFAAQLQLLLGKALQVKDLEQPRSIIAILDDTFASHLQQLLGNALQEKDPEPPRSIIEVRSML